MLAAEEDASCVDRLHAVPRLNGGVQDGGVVVRGDACVVVEDVDAAEPLGRLGAHPANVLLFRHVRLHRECVAGAQGDRLLGSLEVHVGRADLRTLLGEENRRLPAHTAAGTRDHADLSLKPLHQPSVDRNTFLTSE